MLTTQHLVGTAAFAGLQKEWDAVAAHGMTNTPFQTWAYQRAWWTHLHPAAGELHLVLVRDDAAALIAVAALYRTGDTLHFNGCVEETDYLDLICRAEDAEAAWTAVFDCLCSDDFPTWQAIDLCNVPAASPTRDILPQLAASRGFSLHTEIQEVCPTIMLPDSFEAYLDSLDKKQRHETRRKLRRANGADARLHVVTGDEDLRAAVDAFLDLLQKSTPDKDAWLNEGRRAVFHTFAQAALDNGSLQLLFFEVDGAKAAGLFNLDYDGRIWVYNSGLDPDAYGHLSAGVVLTTWAIEKAIADGRQEFDFLRGNESYKYKFGAEDTTIHRFHIERNGK